MTEPMTPERLAEIRERAEAATPGPWYFSCGAIRSKPAKRTEYPDGMVSLSNDPTHIVLEMPVTNSDERTGRAFADMRFALEAHTDIPDLLAEVDRLRKIVESRTYCCDAHQAEVERLRAREDQFNSAIVDGMNKIIALRDWQKRVSDAIEAVPEVLCFCAPLPEGQVCQWCQFISEAKEAL